jgi:hypothetical protein
MAILIYPQALVLDATRQKLLESVLQEPVIGVTRVDTTVGTIAQNGWMYAGDVEHISTRLRNALNGLGIPFVTLFTKQLGGPNPAVLQACWSTPGATAESDTTDTWCNANEASARGWLDGSPYGFPPSAHALMLALSTPNGVVARTMP